MRSRIDSQFFNALAQPSRTTVDTQRRLRHVSKHARALRGQDAQLSGTAKAGHRGVPTEPREGRNGLHAAEPDAREAPGCHADERAAGQPASCANF